MNSNTRTNLLLSLALAVVTFAVFSRVPGNDFVNYDDFQYVTQNRHVMGGLSPENIRWAFTSFHAANWHPLTWISHMADVTLFGMNPRGHHLTSLIIHALNSILLFLFLNRETDAPWRSALVAVLFAVHPLHVESVAWVAERKDVLSTLFALLALLAYGAWARRGGAWRYILTAVLFALGLLAKPMLVTLPLALLLLDYWPLSRLRLPGTAETSGGGASFSGLLMEKLPLLVMSALLSIVTLVAQSRGHTVHDLQLTPLPFRISNALFAYIRYLGKTVWPEGLTVLYPLPESAPFVGGALSAAALVLLTWAVLVPGRRHRYLAAGWLWFLGTLVPVIGIVQVGLQSMADRYTYLPLVGIFIMIVWSLSDLAASRPRTKVPLIAAAALAVVGAGAASWRHTACWKDSVTLLRRAVEVYPDSYYANHMLGTAYLDEGNAAEALEQYRIAQRLNPEFSDTYMNAGIILARRGDYDLAIENFRKAVALHPEFSNGHYNLAVALQDRGKLEEAAHHFRQVIRLDADNPAARFHLGEVLRDMGNCAEAVEHFSAALRLDPSMEKARLNIERCSESKNAR